MRLITKLVILCFMGLSEETTEALHDVGIPHVPGMEGNSPRDPPQALNFPRLFNVIQVAFQEKEQDNGNLHNGGYENFAKQVLRSIAERTAYANSEEDLKTWSDESSSADAPHNLVKRDTPSEEHVGGCVAKVYFIELSADHYPRYLKSYNCTSNCDRTYGRCQGKTYEVKVLQRNSPENAPVADAACSADANLPEGLRCDYKLVPISVVSYCECISNGLARLGR